MIENRLTIASFVLTLLLPACAPAPEPVVPPTTTNTTKATTQVSDMPTAPWAIIFADASGNSFHFLQPSPNATAEFAYTPVTPERSSSGTYSGGMAASGDLTPTQVRQIWSGMRDLRDDTGSHVKQRMMGTGSFRVTEQGKQYDFIVGSGPALDAFMTLVTPIRE